MKNKINKFTVIFCIISTLIYPISAYAINSTNNNIVNSNTSIKNSTTTSVSSKQTNVDRTLKVYDYADLLTASEEKSIYTSINSFIEEYNMDMVVVTINKNNKSSSMAYADDFFDYNGFGVGEERSGILFLIDMDNRKMWISTRGKSIRVYTDAKINRILDYTYDEIVDKDYYGCVTQFINHSKSIANESFEINPPSKAEVVAGTGFMSFLFAGFVTMIFLIIGLFSHRGAKKQSYVEKYITKPLVLHNTRDDFISRNVSKTRRSDDSSSSGGGSSTHISSSGATHGGGGRSF